MDEIEKKEIEQLAGIYKTVSNENILEGEQAIVIHAERLVTQKADDNTRDDEESPTL